MRATIERGQLIFRTKRKNYGSRYKIEAEDHPYIRRYVNAILSLPDGKRKKIFGYHNRYFLKRICYYAEVWAETEANAFKVENISDRGGVNCVDHIVPISFGYDNNICVKLMGSAENLQVITMMENLRKGTRLSDHARQLLINWNINP